MPTLCRPVSEGGVGFDYRLQMAIADKWCVRLGAGHARGAAASVRRVAITCPQRLYDLKSEPSLQD